MKARLMACLVVGAVSTAGRAELRFHWSARETACASSIGIDLDRTPVCVDPNYARHMTWLADVVAVANVTSVQQPGHGPYFTVVEMELVTSLKGGVASTFVVDLQSGPAFSELYQKMMSLHVEGEPTFAEGEQVVVFLTTSYDRSPDGRDRFAHGPNHYSILAKYRVAEGAAALEEQPLHPSRSVEDLETDIALVVKTQAGCR